jgi:hypothetical protein
MNVPIKIIHKFKNNNRRVQYIIYVYIGSNVDNDIMSILETIKNKSFYECYESLSKVKLDLLTKYYGNKWYTSFFNRYHLSDQFNNILKNANKLKTIESKMGKEWVLLHLSSPLLRRITYSFASTYYDYLIARNKIKSAVRKADLDFRTYATDKSDMIGGYDNDTDDNHTDDNDIDEIDNKMNDDDEPQVETIEDFDDMVNNNFNLQELTSLYGREMEFDEKNIKSTAVLISEATNDKSYIKKIDQISLEFNEKLDDITYDIKLEDVYNKVYVTDQFIFMDDNIKTIRNKVTVTLPLSNKYKLICYIYFIINIL